jgi:hypothetical protein
MKRRRRSVRQRNRRRMAGPIPGMAVEAMKGFLTAPE